MQRHTPGWVTSLALVEVPGLFHCNFCFPILQGLRLGRASSLALAEVPGLLFAGCLLIVQCHMPGRANSLALARQSYCSSPPRVPNALPQAEPGVSLGLA